MIASPGARDPFLSFPVFSIGDQFLFIAFVAETFGLVPRFQGRGRSLGTKAIAVPKLPIFPIGMDDIERGYLDRAHAIVSWGKASQALKSMMEPAAILHD